MNHSNKGTQRWPLPKSAGRLQYGLDHRLHAVSKKHRSRRASYTTLKGVSVARPTPYTHQLVHSLSNWRFCHRAGAGTCVDLKADTSRVESTAWLTAGFPAGSAGRVARRSFSTSRA